MLDCILQNVEIYLVIAMDKSVSHPDDLGPRYPRIPSAPFRANPSSRLTDDFNQANQSELKHSVIQEIGSFLSLDHATRFSCVLKHMPQTNLIIVLRHTEPRLQKEPGPDSIC